jgi:hypothetical protein
MTTAEELNLPEIIPGYQGLTAGRAAQLQYWTMFLRDGAPQYAELKGRRPQPLNWLAFGTGRPDIELYTVHARGMPQSLSPKDHLRVELVTRGPAAPARYNQLLERKAEIDAGFAPDTVTWLGPGGTYARRIYVLKDAPIQDPEDWANQHQWLLSWLRKFDHVFYPIVQSLPHAGRS